MKTVVHKENTRGHAMHGWLNAKHSFSFGSYHNPEKIHFGALRVLNDDIISGGMGFGKHPHNNMEIVTIPLEGILEHQDSMGNVSQIKKGEIQVMSAGKGIFHSERNKSQTELLKLLQIWVIPNQQNVEPRYDEIKLNLDEQKNTLHQIVSPNEDDEGLWIYQNAWFYLGKFEQNYTFDYSIKNQNNGVYIFVIEGDFSIEQIDLTRRDAIGIWDTTNFSVTSNSHDSQILVIEVPMNI